MQNNLTNNNPDSTSITSIALSNPAVMRGTAEGVRQRRAVPVENETFSERLSFYFGEYFSGILFLGAVLSFTFLIPTSISKPGGMIAKMIDKFLKKTLDIFGALLGLILALPIFIVIPILIKLDSRGPVFYMQDRVGLNRRRSHRRSLNIVHSGEARQTERRREDHLGKPFKVIKFRTMVPDAEKNSGPVWAIQNDNRITRLGRFLRKTRIDEVPQLLNVLMGDMSLVGPRPERPFLVKDLSQKVPGYTTRLRVRPGITGLAQVRLGYDSSVDSVVEKVRNDIVYIRTWSIWTDMKILMKTVVVVITGRGAC